ncbi:MAG TPA: amidohydrolase family protein, partial [Planctomycetota bacterium]|nr:amidohydrolase family protein [Planctomycetota bacterium]
ADTDLAGVADADYHVTPDAVAVDAFDFTRDRTVALAGGVTTAYLSPGRNRLIPGQGSVVKLAGDDAERRVLAPSCALRVTLGDQLAAAPPLFEPTPAPTADDPLRPARRQLPTARISQLAELRRIFREAQVAAQQGIDDLGPGADENQYDPAALLDVLRGALPLRVRAARADDVRRALQLGGALGTKIVLEDPAELDKVAALAASAGAMVSFRVPVRLGRANPGGENKLDRTPKVRAESILAAARLGIPFALSPAHDDDLDDVLLAAAPMIRAGLAPEQALVALTSGAARVLGVHERVGMLAPGRDADFAVLSGEPFETGTVVEKTWIDGKLAFTRIGESSLLVVRAKKVLPVDGPPLHDAVILIEDGKIKAVGERLPIPWGARVVETRGVVVPGFVDGYCHAGLSVAGGDGQIPRGAPDQIIADAVDPNDPVLREALAAGVTTVVVSGRDETQVAGRAAALKTGATDRAGLVVKRTAAVRFVHDAIDPDALDPLDALIERTQRYLESWQKYEKALAEGKEVEVTSDRATEVDPITGVWEGDLENPQLPFTIGFNFNLVLERETVRGQVTVLMRGQERPPVDLENGTFKDGKLRIAFAMGMGGSLTLEATVGEDTLEGEVTGGFFSGKVKARRVSKELPADFSAGDGAPRKPHVDEALEPVRALLEGKAVAVVRTAKAPAIAALLAWAKKHKITLALHGAADAGRTPGVLGDERPGVFLDPDFVVREDGALVNRAKQLAEAGLRVAITSAATAGARWLPVHAAYAVHHGLDPETALRAVTLNPATILGIADRVGSIAPGKDADLVVFSGDPFELTSRIEAVICNGELMVDNRPR